MGICVCGRAPSGPLIGQSNYFRMWSPTTTSPTADCMGLSNTKLRILRFCDLGRRTCGGRNYISLYGARYTARTKGGFTQVIIYTFVPFFYCLSITSLFAAVEERDIVVLPHAKQRAATEWLDLPQPTTSHSLHQALESHLSAVVVLHLPCCLIHSQPSGSKKKTRSPICARRQLATHAVRSLNTAISSQPYTPPNYPPSSSLDSHKHAC